MTPPFSLLPDTADGRRPGPAPGRRVRHPRAGPASSARRCSSTTRRTCAPGAGRPSPPSVRASTTPPRPSCASPWPRLAVEEGVQPRRLHRRRVPRGPRRRGAAPSGWCCTATTRALDELRRALTEGVGRVVVDSFDELDRIEALVAEGLPVPQGALRITPGVEAHTHEFVRTGQDDSKFGFGAGRGRRRAGRRAGAAHHRRSSCVGLHAHIGSQVFEARFFELAVEALAPFVAAPRPARAVARRWPRRGLRGGRGGPVASPSGAPRCADAVAEAGITATVTAEPGRALVAQAGDHALHGGHGQGHPGHPHLRLRRRRHERQPPARCSTAAGTRPSCPVRSTPNGLASSPWSGKHCESGDVLVRDARVPADLAVGDVLATPVTGAYGHSMGSNYNKVARPAVVFVTGRRRPPGRAPRDAGRPPGPRRPLTGVR